MDMYCRQCEQTAQTKACTVQGVCGKSPEVADLQDLLIHALIAVSIYGQKARELGVTDSDTDKYIIEGLFTTITNVNFDEKRLEKMILASGAVKENIKRLFLDAYKSKNGKEFSESLPEIAQWRPASNFQEMIKQGESARIDSLASDNEDIQSLKEILLYGMKGIAAYADHARLLAIEDEEVSGFFYKGLSALADTTLGADELVALVMECGKANLKCMEILDGAHTGHFGHPVPTQVSWGVKKGPAIIITGHDLKDLKALLEQTEGKGINIYTHGEMLPAHGYPELKKHAHLAGHYGTAWQNQQKEFKDAPAAILFTTNCIQKPLDSYKDNVFTTGLVAWPDVKHVDETSGEKDFSPVIEKAIALGGFSEDAIEREITVGFGHNAVLGVAGKVLDLVAQKKLSHFYLIGGCDGAKPGRNYFTEFAQKVPKDCIILTLACGKFRINKEDYGTIDGIPRLLDVGQCNDAYSAIKIASALADALKCGVNDLPLSMIISWYEQKAVCILLTLLYLGIKNIRLGPTLPAFISPNVLNILVEKFSIKPIGEVDADIQDTLAGN
ncbi:MAG: hydroxylamine reductase [Candidatus Ancaeobacter aquaticus]|nr:hydroxylamine reductase [Candidatus Ancaeobacter aquaticus]